MEIRIVRSDRRTLGLEVRPGCLTVRAPRRMPEREIRRFLAEREAWIRRAARRAEERALAAQAAKRLTEEELLALRAEARADLTARVERFAPLVGVDCGRITVRAQHTRWGSCSPKGTLSFNCLLMLAPPEVRDSVVVHELCHRKHMDHSPAFYREVLRVCPGYRACAAWLRRNGPGIMDKNPA